MKSITNEIVEIFELYLYEKVKSDNTIEKYMRDICFSVSDLVEACFLGLEYKNCLMNYTS